MGVESFKGTLERTQPWKRAFSMKNISKVSSLFIDFNGMIYNALNKVYLTDTKGMSDEEKQLNEKKRAKLMKKDKIELEKLHISTIIQDLSDLVEKFKPQDNLFIAIDGVVNSGKLGQQKGRRLPKGNQFKEDKLAIFDGNSVTPGTKFMINLDKAMEKWVSENHSSLATKVIYSSHLSPGEGEHKIYDYIRREDYIKGDGMNIMYGLDNDLIIIGIVNQIDNFYLWPEDEKGGRTMLSMERLKELIVEQMSFQGSGDKFLLQDFCLIVMFLGNDFLHKFPTLTPEMDYNLKFLIDRYKNTALHLTDENNNIIWEHYYKFLKNYNRFKSSVNEYYNYIKYYLYSEKNNDFIPYPEIGNNIVELKNERGKGYGFNYANFRKEWYRKQFNGDIVQWNGDVFEDFDEELVSEMCVNYLQTVQWVQYYYTKGYRYVSDFQFYHYIYNPLLGDVVRVLGNLLKTNKTHQLRDVLRKPEDFEINVVHQLLSVMPEVSMKIVPNGFKKFYSQIKVLNPEKFEIKDENTKKNKPHQKYPILPTVNVPYINEILKESNYKLPKNLQNKEDLVLYKKFSRKKKKLETPEEDSEKYSVSLDELL